MGATHLYLRAGQILRLHRKNPNQTRRHHRQRRNRPSQRQPPHGPIRPRRPQPSHPHRRPPHRPRHRRSLLGQYQLRVAVEFRFLREVGRISKKLSAVVVAADERLSGDYFFKASRISSKRTSVRVGAGGSTAAGAGALLIWLTIFTSAKTQAAMMKNSMTWLMNKP